MEFIRQEEASALGKIMAAMCVKHRYRQDAPIRMRGGGAEKFQLLLIRQFRNFKAEYAQEILKDTTRGLTGAAASPKSTSLFRTASGAFAL